MRRINSTKRAEFMQMGQNFRLDPVKEAYGLKIDHHNHLGQGLTIMAFLNFQKGLKEYSKY